MSIQDQLNANLKNALKSGDKSQVLTLRGLKSAIKYAEIEVGTELDDDGILSVVSKQAKQRRDSIAEFQKAGRNDLVDQEAAELAILEQFLPAQMSEDAIKEKALTIIAELGVTDVKGMGQVMKRVMAELKGQADGKFVNKVVRQLLNQ